MSSLVETTVVTDRPSLLPPSQSETLRLRALKHQLNNSDIAALIDELRPQDAGADGNPTVSRESFVAVLAARHGSDDEGVGSLLFDFISACAGKRVAQPALHIAPIVAALSVGCTTDAALVSSHVFAAFAGGRAKLTLIEFTAYLNIALAFTLMDRALAYEDHHDITAAAEKHAAHSAKGKKLADALVSKNCGITSR